MLRRDWGDKTEVWEGEESLGEGQEEVRGTEGAVLPRSGAIEGPSSSPLTQD